jgi:hypothetical protein
MKSVDRVASAFDKLQLGDPRRGERVRETVRKMARQPQASLPEAMGSDAALEGAYRLMNNERVSFEALSRSHAAVTAEHAREVGRVLVIHDTTPFEFGHADPDELGYLNTGKAGFYGHYSLVVAFDGSRRPLGIGHVEPIFRTKKPAAPKAGGAKSRKQAGSETARNQERESLRWSRGFATTSALLEGCEVIHVADREGDNYELLAQAIQQDQRFVIRVRVPGRRVEREVGTAITLMEAVQNCRGILQREVFLSSRAPKPTAKWSKAHPPRASRAANLEFSATNVILPRPRYQSKELPASLKLNVVRVFETSPPPNTEPVEWLLYTTEPIATAEEVAHVVDVYRCRWLIEECNKALKTGCKYEHRQFESRQALLTLLALTLPIACELLWLRACARTEPERPATDVLTPIQLQVLDALGSRKLPPQPTVHDALWAVAALGGHIRNNGEPGWLVLYRGMVKLAALEEGWVAALASVKPPSGKPRLSISR